MHTPYLKWHFFLCCLLYLWLLFMSIAYAVLCIYCTYILMVACDGRRYGATTIPPPHQLGRFSDTVYITLGPAQHSIFLSISHPALSLPKYLTPSFLSSYLSHTQHSLFLNISHPTLALPNYLTPNTRSS